MTMNLPPSRKEGIAHNNYIRPLYGLRGEYTLTSGVSLPYFLTLVDIESLVTNIKTHEQTQESLDNRYSLVELYQRQIDHKRVNEDIVKGYLKNPNKVKFFNAITVTLFPKNEDGTHSPVFTDYENNDPSIPVPDVSELDPWFADEETNERSVFGGVQFSTNHLESISRLRWDKDRVEAVAVDGQHRLTAMRIWFNDKENTLTREQRLTRIPVIFLLLSDRAGFKAPNMSAGIKMISREIFTDLNKNAKVVDLATQIILDDRSLESCCVRELLSDSTSEDAYDRIPLSLIRWQDANFKFDSSYYLNSIVNLYLIVSDLLNLTPPKDSMNKEQVLSCIKKLENTLGQGNPRQLRVEEKSLEDFYTQTYCDLDGEREPHTPYSSIPQHYISSAVEGFNIHYRDSLVKLLTKPRPYQQLLIYARANNLIEGEFSQFHAQPREHQTRLADYFEAKAGPNWRDSLFEAHKSEIQRIKTDPQLGEHWAFKTLFQKAYCRLADFLYYQGQFNGSEIDIGSVDSLIEFIDMLDSAGLLYVRREHPQLTHLLWTSVSVNWGNRAIKVTDVSLQRMYGILMLWYYGWRYRLSERTIGAATQPLSHNQILRKVSGIDWPQASELRKKIEQSFFTDAHALKNQEQMRDEERDDLKKERLQTLFSIGMEALKS